MAPKFIFGTGSVVWFYTTTLNWDLEINSWATILNNAPNHHTLTINWDIINNGVIKNNDVWRSLIINTSWNITNNWVWENYNTLLNWTGSRNIFWNPLKSSVTFNSDMTILNSLVLEKWVNFNNKVITLSGTWNTITLSNEGGSLGLYWEIRWWNLVFVWTGTSVRWNIMAPKFIFGTGSVVWFYTTTLNWDLEINSWATILNNAPNHHTLTINWDIINNGVIKNNDVWRSLIINTSWNITNNWVWENSNTYLTWNSRPNAVNYQISFIWTGSIWWSGITLSNMQYDVTSKLNERHFWSIYNKRPSDIIIFNYSIIYNISIYCKSMMIRSII